jgi:saccharopine dehydrogenase-like NADP-dependent oxidoreductase
VDSLRLRVGALPLYPDNRLKYNLSWSTEGLINEYCNPCDAIEDACKVKLLPLEGLEHLIVNGVEYECFNTSGGLGTLCETFLGKVKELNYKTLRYPGHRDLMSFLIQDLGLGAHGKRDLFRQLLEESIPQTNQDKVVVRVSVTGKQNGLLREVTDTRCVVHRDLRGEPWSAIQLATASGVCAAVDLFFEGELPDQGFVKQEQVALPLFLSNRFGFEFSRAHESAN